MSMGWGFILKKFISVLLMPLTLGMIFAMIGLWYLQRNSLKKARFFLWSSFIWIALVTYAPISSHP